MPSVGWGGVTLMSGRRIYLLMWCQGKIMVLRDLSWKRIKNLGKVRGLFLLTELIQIFEVLKIEILW